MEYNDLVAVRITDKRRKQLELINYALPSPITPTEVFDLGLKQAAYRNSGKYNEAKLMDIIDALDKMGVKP